VPSAAVVADGDRPVVFVETAKGAFEARRVTIGKPAGALVRVVDGVRPGEAVVVDGGMLLEGLLRRGSGRRDEAS
jgi:cobalt-zinc-cadmium efflux system membrane fusion protein